MSTPNTGHLAGHLVSSASSGNVFTFVFPHNTALYQIILTAHILARDSLICPIASAQRQKGSPHLEQVRQFEGKKNSNAKVYKIFSIVEKPGNDKNIWLDIGVGRLNRDDSITCKLDCLPLNGVIQIRPHDGRKNGHSGNNMLFNKRNDGGYQG